MTIDAKKMLDQFLNSGMATGVVAGMLGGALARKSGLGGVAQIGGLALVGTLAYQAWQRHKEQQSQLPAGQRSQGGLRDTVGGVFSNLPGVGDLMNQRAPGGSGFATGAEPDAQQEQMGVALLTAMISAAKADGTVDRVESQRIMGQMEQSGLSSEEKSFILGQLASPLSVDDVVIHAKTPEIAAQIYTASALVIDQANDAERAYLETLAQRMNLDRTFVEELQRQMQVMR